MTVTTVEDSLAYLGSPEALASVRRDPYWPKWDSPWWHATLVWELGHAARLPRVFTTTLVAVMNERMVHFFPVRESDLPPGKSFTRDVPCHCQLGTLHQVLAAAGVDVDAELPWLRPWFLRYQLPDGGLNCDETAYGKPNGVSSIVSTLPPLEAVLRATPRPFTGDELSFLDAGARYLIDHKLVCSRRTGAVIEAAWLLPCFPRFYHYDLLRGLDWLTEWAEVRDRALPPEILAGIPDWPDGLAPGRIGHEKEATLAFVDGEWQRAPASRFPLLLHESRPGRQSLPLSRIWARVRRRLG